MENQSPIPRHLIADPVEAGYPPDQEAEAECVPGGDTEESEPDDSASDDGDWPSDSEWPDGF